MNKLTVAKGSILDTATKTGKSLAETIMGAEAIVMLDWSGSMGAQDVKTDEPNRTEYGIVRYEITRKEAAREQLAILQEEFPGKVALVLWGDSPVFVPSGDPESCMDYIGGSTEVLEALRFVHIADDTGIKFFLVTDGEFTSPEWETYEFAEKFETPITGIYIGPDTDDYHTRRGKEQLAKLCSLTGGGKGVMTTAKETGKFLSEARGLFLSDKSGK